MRAIYPGEVKSAGVFPIFYCQTEGNNDDWCWKGVQDLGKSYFNFGFTLQLQWNIAKL